MTILESGWNLWVWLVGVVSRRWVWLVGGIYGYGYNVWVWLVGVVMRYIDILIIIINFTYSTCIRSFFGSSILTSLFIFKMFFRSLIIESTDSMIYQRNVPANSSKWGWLRLAPIRRILHSSTISVGLTQARPNNRDFVC